MASRATIQCPSGDQRGEEYPPESGNVVSSRLLRLRIWIGCCFDERAIPKSLPNATAAPSGDHVGSISSSSPFVSCSGLPPSAGIRYILPIFPGSLPLNTICFPSGDHRGPTTCIGAKVSSRRSLPSDLHSHRFPSGKLT